MINMRIDYSIGETCVKFYHKLEQKLIKFVISSHVPRCTDRHFMAEALNRAFFVTRSQIPAIWSLIAAQRTFQSTIDTKH